VPGVSLFERQQIQSLLQCAAPPPIDPGSGLAIFDMFGDARRAYEVAVAPAMRAAGLNQTEVFAAFDQTSPLRSVTHCVMSAEVVVADLSTINPSVYYVLGLAHAMGRCPIMIAASESSLLFDLANLRCIRYSNTRSSLLRLREELTRALRVFRASSGSA